MLNNLFEITVLLNDRDVIQTLTAQLSFPSSLLIPLIISYGEISRF